MDIGQRIKSLRESNGLTQEELGKAIGVNKATINRYETGVIDIKRTVAIKLAEVLNTTPAYIMGWNEHTPLRELLEDDPVWNETLEKFKYDPVYRRSLQLLIDAIKEVSPKYEELAEDNARIINHLQQILQLSTSGKEKVIDYTELVYNSEKATE